jgi:hypothetical protein
MEMFKSAGCAAVLALVSALAVPVAAMATEFKPDAVALWVARSEQLARVGGDGSANLDADTILGNMKTACDGLQGEQMAHEYGKVPQWAGTSQVYVCSAYGRWSGNSGLFATKVPCVDMKRAIEALGHAKAGDDPEAVVTAAANLKGTVESMLGTAEKGGRMRCRY